MGDRTAAAALACFSETWGGFPDGAFTPAELAACAMREVRQRRGVYQGLVARKVMTPAAAEREIAAMLAIARHLEAEANRDPRGMGRLL